MRPVEEEVELRELHHRLADELVAGGALTSREWEAVFRRVPRHPFVPRVVGWWPPESGETEGVVDFERDRDRWQRLVYSDRLLFVVNKGGRQSSSSMPSMMLRFLKGLHVESSNAVLEIGTGTGYNAAILCERLGSACVTSVDIDPELGEAARAALRTCRYDPALAVTNGADGYSPRAPYDRILATCSVPRIPDAWLEQCRAGGIIVAPLSRGHFEAVALIRLVSQTDGSWLGNFHPGGASFMPLRGWMTAGVVSGDLLPLVRDTPGETRLCTIPEWLAYGPERVNVGSSGRGLEPNFLLRIDIPELSWHWFDRLPAIVSAVDRSWARTTVGEDGQLTVTQGGPHRLWDLVERSWATFLQLGKPGMGRYGMTITRDRRQFVWLDSPDSENRWEL
jgi:protein-L-isoaspartate(D-aspartate) O-methyltransferase